MPPPDDLMVDQPQPQSAIGVDIGGTKCAAGLVRLDEGRVIARREEATRPERGGVAVLDDVIALVESLRVEAKQQSVQPSSIGIGICELVSRDGRVLSEATVRWRDPRICERLAVMSLPVSLHADVRAAARAEALYGAGRDCHSFVYVTVGTGISACFVMEGEPYAGARGLTGTFASSSGLIPGNDGQLHAGPPLESFASGPALAARLAQARPEFQGAATEVLRLAASEDLVARNIVASAGAALGAAIANLVNILDPETVVIGGGLGLAAGLYRESIEVSLRGHVWSEFHRDLKIMSAQLGNDAGIVGAAALGNLHR
ncbi:MAG TPA: ROK family protein [Lacipirellulaceae bacterium]